jgi:hypothetical protein
VSALFAVSNAVVFYIRTIGLPADNNAFAIADFYHIA